MLRSFLALLCVASSLALSGCQCCSKTEAYNDVIDDVNDHTFCMDNFYNPAWDLTRIGMPDWCQSDFNRKWCALGCCKCGNCNQGTPVGDGTVCHECESMPVSY